MAAAAGNDEQCNVELDFQARFKRCYSLPPLTTVAQLQQRIFADTGIEAGRLTLKLMPCRTTMDDGQRTLASYGIPAGEPSWITVDVGKIIVMVRFADYLNLAFSIACYEFDSVGDLRWLIVPHLRGIGVVNVGPSDMDLSCGGVECEDVGAPLSRYGVRHMGWVDVKTAKVIPGLRRRVATSAL